MYSLGAKAAISLQRLDAVGRPRRSRADLCGRSSLQDAGNAPPTVRSSLRSTR